MNILNFILINKFEKMDSVPNMPGIGNHSADRSHASHIQSSFNITGTGSAYMNLPCYVKNKISVSHSHLSRI